ncbi:MAG: hypothetical protein PVJ57_01120 [Phycisphaerae bacterium]|jgi:hypothetical protein
MADRWQFDEKEFKAWWNALPPPYRRVFHALILIRYAIAGKVPRYDEPPPWLGRTLRKADRDTLFGVIAECLHLMMDAPLINRGRRRPKRRAAATPVRKIEVGRPGRQSRAK